MKWEFDTTKREGRKAAMSAVFQELSDATQYIVLGIAINRLQEEEKKARELQQVYATIEKTAETIQFRPNLKKVRIPR